MSEKELSPADVLNLCAWCGRYIPDDQELFSLGTRVHAQVDLSQEEGQAIQLSVGKKLIPAIVATSDSPAKQAGNDILFVLCSEECAISLRDALQESLGERYSRLED